MKKKVLFALIAMFSFLSTWATDVSTFAELKAALEEGPTTEVKLTAPIAVTGYIKIAKTVTLDLNGQKITVTQPAAPAEELEEPFIVKRGGDFTVTDKSTNQDGEIDASNCDLAIKMTELADGNSGEAAKLTVEAGTIKGKNYGISGNGTRNNTEVTINGGSIIATSQTDGTGIYNPQAGTLNINGGYIKGFSSAVELRSGELNVSITGGTLVALSENYSWNPNGNGTTTVGAALAIAQHTTQHPINVQIEGGVFTGTRSLSIANPQNNGSNDVQVSVTGGEFNGPVEVANNMQAQDFNNQFISGGTFDSNVEDYLVDGCEQGEESGQVIDLYDLADAVVNVSDVVYNGTETMPVYSLTIGENNPRTLGQNDFDLAGFTYDPNFDLDEFNEYCAEPRDWTGDEFVEYGLAPYPYKAGQCWAVFTTLGPSTNSDLDGSVKKEFNVIKRELKMTLAQVTQYVGQERPAPKYTLENFGVGDDKTNTTIEGLPAQVNADTETTLAGTYRYSIDGSNLKAKTQTAFEADKVQNYSVNLVASYAELVYKKANVEITVDPESKVYGESDPDEWTFTAVAVYTDDETGEEISRTTLEGDDIPNITITRQPGETVKWIETVGEGDQAEEFERSSYKFIITPNDEETTKNYEFTATNDFRITPKNFVDEEEDDDDEDDQPQLTINVEVSDIESVVYDGNVQYPSVFTVTDVTLADEVDDVEMKKTLEEGVDFEIYKNTDEFKWTNQLAHPTYPILRIVGKGNYQGYSKDYSFAITKAPLTIKVENAEKLFGQDDPEDAFDYTISGFKFREKNKFVSGNPATFDQDAAIEAMFVDGITVSRIAGDNAALYDFTVDAQLKDDFTPNDIDAPGNTTGKVKKGNIFASNYYIVLDLGKFRIKKATDIYYVSSKGVTKEFEKGNTDAPFDGYYLYEKKVVDEETTNFVEITGERLAKLQELMVQGLPDHNELDPDQPEVQGKIAGENVYDEGWWIVPAATSMAQYTLAPLPRTAFAHEGEGTLVVTKKRAFIIPDDKTSVFGEPIVPLTYNVYGADEDGMINKDDVITDITEAELTTTATATSPVNDEEKPYYPITATGKAKWTELVPGLNNEPVETPFESTLAERYPDYEIIFQEAEPSDENPNPFVGKYIITATDKKIFINFAWEKTFGLEDKDASLVVYDPEAPNPSIKLGRGALLEDYTIQDDSWNPDHFFFKRSADESEEVRENVGLHNVTVIPVLLGDNQDEQLEEMQLPAVIDGYAVVFTGTLNIKKAGELNIIVENQGVKYDNKPALTAVDPYVDINGFDETLWAKIVEENDIKLSCEKPSHGYVKNGADINISAKVGENTVTLASNGSAHEVTADEWPWVANYTKVTVTSGHLYVEGDDEITLDIVAFNRASYDAANESADQLIRDYDGMTVKKVNLVCSGQEYKLNGDQWYSMVLPFDTYPRYISQVLGGYAVVDVLDTEKGKATKGAEIRFTTHTGELAANTPFIFKTDFDFTVPQAVVEPAEATEDNPATAAFEGDIEIIYPSENYAWPADQNGNKFIGTYTAAFGKGVEGVDNAILDQTKNLIVNLSGNVSPAKTATAYLRSLGAYIQMADQYNAANVRVIIEEADGTYTIIDAVDADVEAAEFAEGWYTITGVKLEGEPTVTGTYIYNGKKVFIKK